MSSAERATRRRSATGLLATAGLGVAMSGCVSTEQKAAWAHIESARILASQNPTIVRRAGRQVRVEQVSLLAGGARIAIAVRLHNLTPRPVNDLPISVGVRAGPRRIYLNRAGGLDYFTTHVALIRARATEIWVFSGRHRTRLTGRAFAVIGDHRAAPTSATGTVPLVRTRLVRDSAGTPSGQLTVTVRNLSPIPQPQVLVYALAMSSEGYAAVGRAVVTGLGTGSSTTARLNLIGRPDGARIELEALPTLFQ